MSILQEPSNQLATPRMLRVPIDFSELLVNVLDLLEKNIYYFLYVIRMLMLYKSMFLGVLEYLFLFTMVLMQL